MSVKYTMYTEEGTRSQELELQMARSTYMALITVTPSSGRANAVFWIPWHCTCVM